MTLLWADSFDHYGATTALMLDGAYAQAVGTLSTAQARTGARSFLISNDILRRVFGGAKVTAGAGGAFYIPALPSSDPTLAPFVFCDAANVINVAIVVESTGIISALRGTTGTSFLSFVNLGDSGVPVVTANAWNHIEAKVKIHGSTGTVEVRVNGVTVLSLTGQNTQQGAAETSQVRFLSAATTSQFYVDDVYAWDINGSLNNDFVGDRKVITDFPDADTADVDWTRSTGSTNFGVIDENPPNDDTDYLTTSTVGDKAGVTFPDLPAEVTNVAAVILIHKSRKTDAGDANIQLTLGSNGADAAGTDRPMTTAYTLYHDVFEADPDTSAPFTRAAAQAVSWTEERTL